ncbi:hypothetical protein GO998_12565 [Ralstonia syzygii]|uniref:Uncharacterized protein n=1 Tax=Ralstonia syzygii TaxID=28097 RepID=A0ABX7ZGF8_9RALS|nr:hypothetical protein [Ralstonia syzygii]QUP54517.1 hypothetical protein GO998_12565 [Ralstonia syzygii]
MDAVRTKEGLAAVLRQSLAEKVSTEVFNEFIFSIAVEEGNIAHMRYGAIERALSPAEFAQLLEDLGIPGTTFQAYKDKSCEGNIQFRSCVDNPGNYCNPSYCHGN